MDRAECFGLGGTATRRPVLGRAVADVGISPAPCQSRESGRSPVEPRFPCLRRPGLEELPVGAGCGDLPTANLKSRVHWEHARPSGPTTQHPELWHLQPLEASLTPQLPWGFPFPQGAVHPFPSWMPVAAAPVSLPCWLFTSALDGSNKDHHMGTMSLSSKEARISPTIPASPKPCI